MRSKLKYNTRMSVGISRDILNGYLNKGINGDRNQILRAIETFRRFEHYSLQRVLYGEELAKKVIEEILKVRNS